MKKWLLALVFFGLAYLVFDTLKASGYFLEIVNSENKKVRILNAPPGIEDIAYDPSTGIAFLSSHDRRNFKNNGAIYFINTLEDSLIFKPFKVFNMPKVFKPHGISFYEKEDKKYLFVISHPENGHEVHKFQINEDSLILKDTYKSPGFISPNDLAAVGENQFYFSNDHGSPNKIMKTISDFLRIKSGFVAYFDNGKISQVSDKIAYPNGVFWSNINKKLFVSSTLDKSLRSYEVEMEGLLKLTNTVKTEYGLDNIDEDYQGNIYVGAHPQMLRFLKHAKDPKEFSPSAVLKFKNNEVQTVWINNGKTLSGLSVAVPFQDQYANTKILLGSVFEKRMVVLEP